MQDVYGRIARTCGASRHASVAACRKARMSAHAHKVFVFALSALVLCVSLHPSRAYAEVVWAETSDSLMSAYVYDYDYSEYGRRCALAEFVGYNWETASSSVRSKVLEDSTVAMCLDPSNRRCINVAYEWFGDIPVFSQAVEVVFSIFGRQRVWQCSMTSAEYFAVQDAFKNAVYPNDGTGSGGGNQGYPQLSSDVIELTNTAGYVYVDNNWVPASNYTWQIKLGSSLLSAINTKLQTYPYMYACIKYHKSNSTKYSANIYLTEKEVDSTYFNPSTWNSGDLSILYANFAGGNFNGYQYYNNSNSVTVSGGTIIVDMSSNNRNNSITVRDNYQGYSFGNGHGFGYGFSFGEPYVPQPDPPAQQPTLNAPTAPTLPTTNAPTTPDSTPDNYTTIVNNNYTQPTYNQQPTGTSQDYTPWLDEIIVLLRSINDYIYMGFDDLSTWFSVVDADMRTGFDNVLARLSSLKAGVHADLVWLADNLDDWITNAALYLATYLHECEQYLGDIVGEYSNQIASVVTWLRRIYSRLGGNGSSKPSVTTDEPGFFDWLIDLFTRFLNDLLSNLPDWLQRLIGGFQDLSEHFPFSIPWDIAAMLQLLYHEPVTPVFDMPMPTIEIDGVRSVDVHIDLTSWDGVAAIVREMVFIIFAVSLALNTKKLLSNLDM